MIKVGDFVHCAGEADEVFKVEKINKNNTTALMNTGWWEPISKLTVLPPEKISSYTRTVYIYDKDMR